MDLKNIVQKEICEIKANIQNGQYKEALFKWQNFDRKYPLSAKTYKVSTLIDIGSGLKDEKIILDGVKAGKSIVKNNTSPVSKKVIYYNIANGYTALFEINYERDISIQIVNNKNLQDAKKNYRDALNVKAYIDNDFEKKLWTNYGNCLDYLGRGIEAFYAYDEALKIDPTFAMALANKALALCFFADISGTYKEAMNIKAYQMLNDTIKSDNITVKARDDFQENMKEIESKFQGKKDILLSDLKHREYNSKHLTKFEKFYIDFCIKNDLFLNFHIHERNCEASISDPIFISLVTNKKDFSSFYNLSKYINQIKEDYIVARLLLVQSQFKMNDFIQISKRTSFVNTLDGSIFNLYTGLLKSAFNVAYNIFDKISRFINEYLQLGINCKIYFSTIWENNPKKSKIDIRSEILNSKNISLFALCDIYLDYQYYSKKQYEEIMRIRNSLVHEKLIIYDDLNSKFKKMNKDEISYGSMLNQTLELFKLARSAIIYLINLVELEERKKIKNSKNLFPTIYPNIDQTFNFLK